MESEPQAQRPLVLVTGSAGLIGSRVCQRLARDYLVVGLDIKEPDSKRESVEWIKCDFTKQASVREALASVRERCGSRLASAIHLAAYYDFSGEPSPLYDELTVEGTRRLLKELKNFDEVEQFIFSSSLLVMKPCETGELLTESSPTQAEWEYPRSKLDAEKVIQQECGRIPTVVLRLAGAYDEAGHSPPITQNIRRIAEKQMESYFFPGNAEHGQAFIHLDDVVDCLERVVERRKQLDDYEVLLIAEEECLSYEELQDRLGELIHGEDDWPTIRIPKAMAKAGAWVQGKLARNAKEEPFIKPWMVDLADAHYPVDMTLAKARLDWAPRRRLSRTLPAMVASLKNDPRAWYKENKIPLPDRETLEEIQGK
jgi:nucleoside-diphosphate-sugar epimerase